MRLSFSTRGWQRLGWEELLETAADAGLEGVEVYDLPKRQDLWQRGGPFDRYNTVSTARQLRERGLSIPCLDTSFDLASEGSASGLLPLLETARDMHLPCVAAAALREAEDTVRENLRIILPAAR